MTTSNHGTVAVVLLAAVVAAHWAAGRRHRAQMALTRAVLTRPSYDQEDGLRLVQGGRS
jgi:hypothetical protein